MILRGDDGMAADEAGGAWVMYRYGIEACFCAGFGHTQGR
jgi:hypothetical protein